MPGLPLRLTLPPPLDQATAKFTSISNALGGIREYDHGGLVNPALHDDVANNLPRRARQQLRALDRDSARQLRIAWQTELSARVNDQFDDDLLRRVAAQTLPVQAYYAIFNAGRAATSVRGTTCNTHTALHRDYQTQRVASGYGSWGVALDGDPENVMSCALTPSIVTPAAFNLMERSHKPEEYLFAALRMTRRWKVEHARDDWLRKNRKTSSGSARQRLPNGKRAELVAGLRPTTILDFLYELRVRTNYEGIEEYGSNADDATVDQFHRGLLHLADLGLLHYEMDIARSVWRAAYDAEVKDWVRTTARAGAWAREAVERRRASIVQAVTP
jgi:hypothetical protein